MVKRCSHCGREEPPMLFPVLKFNGDIYIKMKLCFECNREAQEGNL